MESILRVNVHLVLLLGYTALLFGLGLLVARRVRGSADFFVAGRALSAPLLMSTILAANIGAGATVGGGHVARGPCRPGLEDPVGGPAGPAQGD